MSIGIYREKLTGTILNVKQGQLNNNFDKSCVAYHETNIILFDGVCNLCNKTVQFVIRHDPKSKFRFASLQSEVGMLLLKQLGLPIDDLNTLIYITDERFYLKSTAALNILRRLDRGWVLMYGLIIVPRFLRDLGYDFIARRRYKWFGKKDLCMIPAQELSGRFLE